MTELRFGPLIQARVRARRTLFRGLRLVPDRAAAWVHDVYVTSAGRRRALVRPLARALFYRAMAVPTFVVPGGGGERLHAVGSRLERTLYWFGEQGYEQAEAQLWRTLCRDARDVLEIGANIGYYTVVGALAAPATRYTAVEANPEAAAVVRRNLELNGLAHVEVLQVAVVGGVGADGVGADGSGADGSGAAEVELAVPDQESHSVAPTGSFLTAGAEGRGRVPARERIRVPAVAAAPLFAGRDLVKLDIEGAEALVIDAALPEILAARPVLLVEILPGSARLRAIVAELAGEGFAVFEVAQPLRPLEPGALDDGHRTARDVVLVPRERLAALAGAA